jgi:hypothetical protein
LIKRTQYPGFRIYISVFQVEGDSRIWDIMELENPVNGSLNIDPKSSVPILIQSKMTRFNEKVRF